MMKNIMILMSLVMLMIGCTHQRKNELADSETPIKDRYGTPRVSPTAKKSLKGEMAATDENKVVCKLVKKTGSHISVVTCKTKDEFKKDSKRSRDAVVRMIDDTNQNRGRFDRN